MVSEPASGTLSLYSVYGLGIASDHDVPGLPEIPGGRASDVRLVFHAPPVRQSGDEDAAPFYTSVIKSASGAPILRMWLLPQSGLYRLLHATGAEFFVDRRGGWVWVTPHNHGDADAFELLLTIILSFVIRLRGGISLHASVVALGNRAVALAGPPGAGKSTLAAALGWRGHRLLTDDVAAIWRDGSRFLVFPGPQRIQPRLGIEDSPAVAGGLPRTVTTAGDCLDLEFAAQGFTQPREPMELRSVCFLEPGDAGAGGPFMAPTTVAAASVRLIGDAWAVRLQDRTMRVQSFMDIIDFSEQAACRVLTFPHRLSAIDECCRLVETLETRP